MRARALVALVCLLTVLGRSAAGATERSLDDVREELDEARERVTDLEGRQAGALSDLDEADERVAALGAELTRLEQSLGSATAVLGRAEDTLTRTTTQIAGTRARLAATGQQLIGDRERFRRRVRASYMYGGTDAATLLIGAQDIGEAQRSLAYIDVVLRRDESDVELVSTLSRQIEADLAVLGHLKQRQADARAVAAAERDGVAQLVDRQELVTVQAQAETDRHQRLLAELESDEDTAVALVDALEGEGDRLADELAARAQQAAVAKSPSPAAGPAAVAAPGPPAPGRAGAFQRPVEGRISSGFGYRVHPIAGTRRLHAGIDFAAASGTPIVAAHDGVVVSAGGRGGYGQATVIDHGGGVATLYAHQSRLGVRAGQQVARGQVIGAVGSTGYSTGPHLHFEVRLRGTPVDPAGYL